MPHVKQNHQREIEIWFKPKKLGLEWTINGQQKPFLKNPIQKIENSKNRSEIAACEQKTTSEKANFRLNNVFSL